MRGVDIFESSKYDGGLPVSFAGGSHMIFAGSEMNDDASLNSVKFKTGDLSSAEVRLTGTGLTCKAKMLLFNNLAEFNSNI